MGRGRKGTITQSHNKLKSNRRLNTKREKNIGLCNKQSDETKINLHEDTLEFIKNMDQQQLVDFLLSNAVLHAKTSSGINFEI